MKKIIPGLFATIVGLTTLIAFLLRPTFDPILHLFLQWGIIVISATGVVGVARYIISHSRLIFLGKKGFFFSLVIVLSFLISFIGGMLLNVENTGYTKWVRTIQLPIEVSLLGILAIILIFFVFRFFATKKWNTLTVSFGISTFLFLFFSLGFLQSFHNPTVDLIIRFFQRFSLAGSRGLILGISLGVMMVAFRLIFGGERHYGD